MGFIEKSAFHIENPFYPPSISVPLCRKPDCTAGFSRPPCCAAPGRGPELRSTKRPARVTMMQN